MTKRIGVRVGASCLAVSAALLVASAPAAGAKKPISGKLSKPGYSVIALAKNGKAKAVRTKPRKFKLRPPAQVVTLQLRAKDGTYAGPIVVGLKKKGKVAILGVKAGAKLGKVKVKGRKGYAKVKRKPPKKFVDAKRKARARKGVPIGAGRFGRVLSKHTKGGAPGDRDLDGVPDPLDIDDDGDLVLDNLDTSSSARGAQTSQGCGPNNANCQPISSSLNLCCDIAQGTVNANALSLAGLSSQEIQDRIDAAIVSSEGLRFSPLTEPEELDCGGQPDPANPDGWSGGLSYCTRGGTGIAAGGGPGSGLPFPGPAGGQFDSDGDGYGTLPKPAFVAPRATTADIKTGDVLNQVVTSGGTETLFPATLNFVFVTAPALVSYSDTAGNCARISGTPGSCATEFSYPVSPGEPGTGGNGFPVAGGPCPSNAPPSCVDGDVVLTLTFWRPERQPIPNDPPTAQWMDIGHLTYVVLPGPPQGCQQDTLSSTDPNLTTPSLPLLGVGGLTDLEDDRESSPGNTFTYTLDLSQCLDGVSFDPGDEVPLNFQAGAAANDFTQQTVPFKRQ